MFLQSQKNPPHLANHWEMPPRQGQNKTGELLIVVIPTELQFLKSLEGRNALVLGAGRSGRGAVKLLDAINLGPIFLGDDRDPDSSPCAEPVIPADFLFGTTAMLEKLSSGTWFLIKSPGIPSQHPVVEKAKTLGFPILGELELASLCRPAGTQMLAVTGTNGKTTTTAWAQHLLERSGIPSLAVGNIGLSFAEAVLDPRYNQPGFVFVVESSSFQLEDTHSFHPKVAVMTNFSPDHLDRHGTLAAYFQAKQRIWKSMTPSDLLVINGSDPTSHDFAEGCLASLAIFQRDKQPDGRFDRPAAWTDRDGQLWLRHLPSHGESIPLIPKAELALPGPHNLENALAATLAVSAFLGERGVKGLCEGLRQFGGVEHRIEACGVYQGVPFYNDSKATNVDATEKALLSFPDGSVILIAGGRDKHSPYGQIRELVARKCCVLITLGEAAPLIEESWGGVVPIHRRVGTMAEAVTSAASHGQSGRIVLLSPACASFDMYNNYEERGRDFKALVARLIAVSS
jgi:UDP-N-acetylmuramoylalanine--D-glutamate ligase